ncbi:MULTISPECIES: hypothetical protein [Brucella]|jgi:uncharacterized membrane protein YccC|uniref:hypothetical protein n=1 Tax=Brucella TaxID=234 RepID=UPI00044682FF|nr:MULTISPECIES: hypothetical protein [Brucella/Ochrobactrum group]MCR5944016.1 hypothetical protein [Ochrobactrum sp. XJ1]EXL01884.1 hypothetical protein BG46_13540 [Brucella anthropi]KIU70385.1 hypothetical protein TR92_00820 [Brucella anthropi]MBA8862798.1 putative membrane protein YccC [Brucella anthropi]MDG9793130.1 hypothetical protein [Brucella anthropi]
MSSIALNSRNITMISRLLREARKPGDTQDLRTDAARYLARRFQEGTRDEGRLQIALKQFIQKHKAMAKSAGRYDDGGGAVKMEK